MSEVNDILGKVMLSPGFVFFMITSLCAFLPLSVLLVAWSILKISKTVCILEDFKIAAVKNYLEYLKTSTVEK